MPLDGLTLGFLARELSSLLVGGRIDKLNQPERDELLLTIRNQGANHHLLISVSANNARIHLTREKRANPLEPPMFCMLLRKHLTSGRILSVSQIEGDRVLRIDIEVTDELGDRVQRTLLIELMGKHSNIMLLRPDGRIIDSIKHVTEEISRVREVLPGLLYEAPPRQNKLPYDALTALELLSRLRSESGMLYKALAASISGLSPLTSRELAFRATGDEEAHLTSCDLPSVAEKLSDILTGLQDLTSPRLLLSEDDTPLDALAFHYLCRAGLPALSMATLSDTFDAFYRERDRRDRINQKSAALNRVLRNNIERCQKKLALQLEALSGAASMEEYRISGELITASQHMIKKGMREVLLPNYYDPEMKERLVKLHEKLSPAQNAQRYFKLYHKARSAKELAAEQIARTEEELMYLEGQLNNLEKCSNESELNEIREELTTLSYVRATHNRRQMKALPESKPLHFVSPSGLHILVGKNNLQNDKLTSSAGTNETWLHTKDIPGSHVIIASAQVDDETLKLAAMLAAHYSKAKDGSQVPVDYTLRKHVKKPSGAKPGFVTYTHQKTLFVTPDASRIRSIQEIR